MPPTSTITITNEIASYYVDLPSGGQAQVQMSMTAGDVVVATLLVMLLFMALFLLVRQYAYEVRV